MDHLKHRLLIPYLRFAIEYYYSYQQAGLVCLMRDNYEHVPGCDGSQGTQFDATTDFCYVPIPLDPNLPPLVIKGDGGNPASAFPLGLCEGECDNDNQCAVSYKLLVQ